VLPSRHKVLGALHAHSCTLYICLCRLPIEVHDLASIQHFWTLEDTLSSLLVWRRHASRTTTSRSSSKSSHSICSVTHGADSSACARQCCPCGRLLHPAAHAHCSQHPCSGQGKHSVHNMVHAACQVFCVISAALSRCCDVNAFICHPGMLNRSFEDLL